MFFWNSCFFNDPADVGKLVSGSSAFSKTSLNIWKFTVHVLLKPGLENFEHYFTSVRDEYNCAVVENSLSLPFLMSCSSFLQDFDFGFISTDGGTQVQHLMKT